MVILSDTIYIPNSKRTRSYPAVLIGRLGVSKEFQPLYLQPIITQYFIDNKSEIWLLFLIAHSKR